MAIATAIDAITLAMRVLIDLACNIELKLLQRLFLARVVAALRADSRRLRVAAALRPAARRLRVNAPCWAGVSLALGFAFMVSLSF